MASSNKRKPVSDEEANEKRRGRRIGIFVLVAAVIVFLGIWFGREYFGVESVISETPVTLDGKNRILKFSEKTNEYRMRNADGIMESGISHYAYFIELIDSASKVSLDKIRFTSPVNDIQNMPELIAFSNGTVWVISTTNMGTHDTRGFILKFTVQADKITEVPFVLDNNYHIRAIKENKVILSEVGESYTPYSDFFGGIYLDLKSERIVDDKNISD
jgi:hypothetical protein